MWIWVTAASLLVFGTVGTAAAVPATRGKRADQRLNVVLILSDDERSDGTAVMKNVQTLLANHGVSFTDAHVTTSMCGPSRASILTGQYAHHTGVLDNFGPHAYPAFKEQSEDLPTWMQRTGYQTALVGKYINGYTGAAGHHSIPPGWDDWQVMDSIPMEAYYNYSINDNGRLEHYGNKPSDYSTTVLTNKAVQFIHGARRPFFLYFAPVHRTCRRFPTSATRASSRTSRRSTRPPSTSATSARSRGASGTRTCSAPPRSCTSTTCASARRSRCLRSIAASAASCRRSRPATS